MFNLCVKPWSVPLEVVEGLCRGQIFEAVGEIKVFTGVSPRPITTPAGAAGWCRRAAGRRAGPVAGGRRGGGRR